MQRMTGYGDVSDEVCAYLSDRAKALRGLGVATHRIALDPGLGFAKTPAQNLALTQGLPRLVALRQPVLVGWSRKSTLGLLTGRQAAQRVAASVAAAVLAVHEGARIVRVHDVAETVDALKVWIAVHGQPASQAQESPP